MKKILIFLLVVCSTLSFSKTAIGGDKNEEFNVTDMIMHHIKDSHEFPDGVVDHYISYEGKDRDVSFRCYVYPDGAITKRSDNYLLDFNDYVFKKFNE